MANWIDVFSLCATVTFFGAVVYGILFLVRQINEGVASTKESLKSRGLEITDSGVSVKTSKRFDREDYIDATQRGFVKAFNASSFRKGGAAVDPATPTEMERQASSASTKSSKSTDGGERKRKKLFGSKPKE